MASNLDRYKKDLDTLVSDGDQLHLAMTDACQHDELVAALTKEHGKEGADSILKSLPFFNLEFQSWYSEAKALIRQVLPDRLADFVGHYEKPKGRKEITSANYVIEDYLQGLTVTRTSFGASNKTGPSAAVPQFFQQLAILKSVKGRFESSLFDIRQLVQGDLFDGEIEAARELAKNKFARAAGALAGVVLERHLAQTCENHQIKIPKKDPSISELNDALKNAGVIEVPQWRSIQHLADIRNLCDHSKKTEPTAEQVEDLIAGATKTTKTLF